MEHIIIYPDYLDAVRYAVESHCGCLAGKGKVTGRKFAELIRRSYDQANPMNFNAAELAGKYIAVIEVTGANTVRWQFK